MTVKRKKVSKKIGPQGRISRGAYDAKSPRHDTEDSYVLGNSTNKSPNIRGLTPEPKKKKKRS